jgi:hypothetical protein
VLPCESVTFTVKVSVVALVDVPLITPVLAFKLSGDTEPLPNVKL